MATVELLNQTTSSDKVTLDSVIAGLILERSGNAGYTPRVMNATERRELARKLDMYRKSETEGLYTVLCKISIGKGTSSKIGFGKLAKDETIAAAIREAQLERPSLPVFNLLKKLRSDLYAERKRIFRQAKMVRQEDGTWLCAGSYYDALIEGKMDLERMIVERKAEIMDAYEYHYANYLQKIKSLVTGYYSYSEEEQIQKLLQFSKKFPTRQQIEDKVSCYFVINKLPSLKEASQRDAELAISEFAVNNRDQIYTIIEKDIIQARELALNMMTDYVQSIASDADVQNIGFKKEFKSLSMKVSRLIDPGSACSEVLKSLREMHGVGRKTKSDLFAIAEKEQTLEKTLESLKLKLEAEKESIAQKQGVKSKRFDRFSF